MIDQTLTSEPAARRFGLALQLRAYGSDHAPAALKLIHQGGVHVGPAFSAFLFEEGLRG